MGLFTNPNRDPWYSLLIKSHLTPPNYAFPIVWSILYLMMGISLFLIWSSPAKNKKSALIVFGLQLFLNFIWSFIFFYKKNPTLALVDICLLWIAIVLTIIQFYRISKLSAFALLPYLIWVSFAIYLNLFIVINNKSLV